MGRLEDIRERYNAPFNIEDLMISKSDFDWLFDQASQQRHNEHRMTFNRYQRLASRTAKSTETDRNLMANFALGLSGEAGETADLIKKYRFHDHPLNLGHLSEELGDVIWYASQLANLANIDFNEIAEHNISKLTKRYPKGFNSEDSLKRVDHHEQRN